ncbi:MAG: hypothetical protein RL088_2447 [Verrucomicrobiota bacterium]
MRHWTFCFVPIARSGKKVARESPRGTYESREAAHPLSSRFANNARTAKGLAGYYFQRISRCRQKSAVVNRGTMKPAPTCFKSFHSTPRAKRTAVPSHHTVAPFHHMVEPSRHMGEPFHRMVEPSHLMVAPFHHMAKPSHRMGLPSHHMVEPLHRMGEPSPHMGLPWPHGAEFRANPSPTEN